MMVIKGVTRPSTTDGGRLRPVGLEETAQIIAKSLRSRVTISKKGLISAKH